MGRISRLRSGDNGPQTTARRPPYRFAADAIAAIRIDRAVELDDRGQSRACEAHGYERSKRRCCLSTDAGASWAPIAPADACSSSDASADAGTLRRSLERGKQLEPLTREARSLVGEFRGCALEPTCSVRG